MTDVLAPPVGEVLTEESARLLLPGDLLQIRSERDDGGKIVVVEWVSSRGDVKEVDDSHMGYDPDCYTFHSRPSLAAPTVQVGEDLGFISAQEAEIPDMNKSGDASLRDRIYLDCEFDGHNGPLLSMALVRENGHSIHIRADVEPMDLWVRQNVLPLMDCHDASETETVYHDHVGRVIRGFLGETSAPVIIADSPVDIGRFCRALSTGGDGQWASADYPLMTFEVHNVDCYPTALEGAVQHNAWWDAMALMAKLTGAASTSTAGTSNASKPNPQTHEAERRIALEAALSVYDARIAPCPINGEKKSGGGFADCTLCGASMEQNCGLEASASYTFVKTVRALLTTKAGE